MDSYDEKTCPADVLRRTRLAMCVYETGTLRHPTEGGRARQFIFFGVLCYSKSRRGYVDLLG